MNSDKPASTPFSEIPSFMRAIAPSSDQPAESHLPNNFFSNNFIRQISSQKDTHQTVGPATIPCELNSSIITDESCPEIESDAETMINQQTFAPRLMQIRNPSRNNVCLTDRSQSPNMSPMNIKMNPKQSTQTFSYIQTMKPNRAAKKVFSKKQEIRIGMVGQSRQS